jgi:hypothetical protein
MKRDLPLPHVGMRFLHATLQRAGLGIPAPCTVRAIRRGVIRFDVDYEPGTGGAAPADHWPLICMHAIPTFPPLRLSDEACQAIDAAMHEDKLRGGYDARRIEAGVRAELDDTVRHARTLYPMY